MTEPLCDDCHQLWTAWFTYKPALTFAIHTVNDNLQEVLARRTGRFDLWRQTIRSQQALIRDICERTHQVPQPALFEMVA